MSAEVVSPWPFLLSKLRQASKATVGSAELQAVGLDADKLLKLRVIERLGSNRWRVPDCEHNCYPNLDFETRREEGFVGIACPEDPPCWPGWRWHPVSIVETFCCPAARIFEALREINGLEPLEAELNAGIVPVGRLKRRNRNLPVVWMLQPPRHFTELCLGLRKKLRGDGLIVLLSLTAGIATGVRLKDDIVALGVSENAHGDLGLWRALDALDPDYRRTRVQNPEAVFDEVTIEFATIPNERHIVRINGYEFAGFQKSDLKFLRLLRLAVERSSDQDIDRGGWLKKYRLQGDEKDHDIENIRVELRTHEHPDLSKEERNALLKTSPKRDGTIRLALQPQHIRFDPSLADFRFVGEQQTTNCKGERRQTAGAEKLAKNLAQGKAIAERLLKDCRKRGMLNRQ